MILNMIEFIEFYPLIEKPLIVWALASLSHRVRVQSHVRGDVHLLPRVPGDGRVPPTPEVHSLNMNMFHCFIMLIIAKGLFLFTLENVYKRCLL